MTESNVWSGNKTLGISLGPSYMYRPTGNELHDGGMEV